MAEDKSLEDIDLAFDLGSSASNTPPSTSSEIDGDEVDPIAVVGLSLKFPQEATTAEAFWEMLDNGRSAMTEFPSDRLNVDAFYHPDSSRRGTVRNCQGNCDHVNRVPDISDRYHCEAVIS